jgi:O-antigen/teichoic acid export membrane protein
VKTKLRNLLLAIWIGGLGSLCAIVAPAIFSTAPDRHLAGQLTGRLFHLQAWVGLGLALLVLGFSERGVFRAHRKFSVAVVLAALTPIVADVVVQPLMHQAQIEGLTAKFVALHGVAGALYLIASLSGLVALWINRPAE